ncbi:MAG TPA: hypothetical protein ACFYDZ_09845 [Candidatus Brocadiaceae bacterium]
MNIPIIEKFIENISVGKTAQTDRFYEIYSARGFLLELDKSAGNIRLSDDAHRDDGEFLEALQHIHYKKMYTKPHQDVIDKNSIAETLQDRHVCFDTINTQLYDINNKHYLTELFTQEIPVDLFRLNWARDWYGKFDQFKNVGQLPAIRVYDLEPFIARLVKSISSLGISTWSSCEGHWGEPAYIVFDGTYHRTWFQALLNKFILKKLNLVCTWEWLGWDERCSIRSPGRDILESYLEIQNIARLLYENRIYLRTLKKQVCSLLTDKHKNMNQKELLSTFETYLEELL